MVPFCDFLFTFLFSISVAVTAYLIVARYSVRKGSWFAITLSRFQISRRAADRAFAGLVVLYVLVFLALSLLKHYAFTSGRDLAQYDQIVWNSLHGRLFENTIVVDAPNFLGKTFTPIMLAFVPLYALWANPDVLLIVETLALGASAFPLYWLARDYLGPAFALVIALAFFLTPALQFMNLDEFHEIALAPFLLNFSLYFLLRRRYTPFFICLLVAMLVKEEIALVAMMFGLFVFIIQGQRRLGVLLFLFGGVSAWLLIQYVIPFFRQSEFGSFYYVPRYGYLGRSLPEILGTIISRPDIVAQQLWVQEKIEYALELFVPLAFLPLIGIEITALAIPTFGYTFLSQVRWQYSIQTAYPAPLVPFLFFGIVIGLQRLLSTRKFRFKVPAMSWALGALIVASSLTSYYLRAPGPLARSFDPDLFRLNQYTALLETQMQAIPSTATVIAQNEFMSRVSDRKRIYESPSIPDYRQADYIVVDTSLPWYQFHGAHWNRYINSGYFEPVFEQGTFLIARRRSLVSVQVQFGDQITLTGYSLPPIQTLDGLQVLRPVVQWRADKTISESHKMALQLVDADGHVWAEENREPQEGAYPTTQWVMGEIIGDQYVLRLPPTMPAGEYQVTIGVQHDDDYLVPSDALKDSTVTETTLATVRIEKNKLSYPVSDLVKIQPVVSLFVDMQDLRFLGHYPLRKQINPGELLHVGLYWRARVKPREDYVVEVQLRDARDRAVFAQSSRPAKDTYPTTLWESGEVLLDWHDIAVPKNMASGNYVIYVVLRNGSSRAELGQAMIADLTIN